MNNNNYNKHSPVLSKGRNRNKNRGLNDDNRAIYLLPLKLTTAVIRQMTQAMLCDRVSLAVYQNASLHLWREFVFVCLLIWIWWLRSNDSFKKWKIDVCFLDSAVCYKSMTTKVSSKRAKKQTMTVPKRESTNVTWVTAKQGEVSVEWRHSIRLQLRRLLTSHCPVALVLSHRDKTH